MKHLLYSKLQTPTFGPALVMTFTLLWVSMTLTRGADYFLTDTPGTFADLMLNLDWGLKRLGVVLVVSAVLFFAAVASRRHIFVWCAHALLAAAYFGMAWTILGAVNDYGGGVSHLIVPVSALAWHVGLMWLMGVVPRDHYREVRDGAHART